MKSPDAFSLADLEALRLLLRGDSVIDWHRLNFVDVIEARELIRAQELDPNSALDRERLEVIQSEAVAFLRRRFDLAIPQPVEEATVEELMLLASSKGHRQVCACTILKAMHIIHHLDGRELSIMLPMSSQEIFRLVEEKVYRVIGGLLAVGSPIDEFIGGRKNKDSLCTKLLSKQETIAAAVYDKLRFRIVCRTSADLMPVLSFLTRELFPFNYVVPGQSTNTLLSFRAFCESHDRLRHMVGRFQVQPDDDMTPNDNQFSSSSYRVIHFVVDMPVRVPDDVLAKAPPKARSLGSVIFVLVEFQLLDRETEEANEQGDASHAKYKERQRDAVMRRLKLGAREMREPPRATRSGLFTGDLTALEGTPATPVTSEEPRTDDATIALPSIAFAPRPPRDDDSEKG